MGGKQLGTRSRLNHRSRTWAVLVLAFAGCGGVWTFRTASAGKSTASPPTICYVSVKSSFGTVTTNLRGMTDTGGSPVTIASKNVHRYAVPRWRPDGQRVLYLKKSTPDTLVSCAPDGSGEQALVNTDQVWAFIGLTHPSASGTFSSYDWSPDGQWIVFDFDVRYASGITVTRLFLARVADGLLQQITDDNSQESHTNPRWSGALNLLSYVYLPYNGAPDEEHELWVMNPDGTGRRQIIGAYSLTPVAYAAANWSNGGNFLTGESSLVFASLGGLVIVDINLLAVDPVANVRPLIAASGYQLQLPTWSPDDTKVVMMRGASGISQIATYDLVTGATKVLVQSTTETLRGPDWRTAP